MTLKQLSILANKPMFVRQDKCAVVTVETNTRQAMYL